MEVGAVKQAFNNEIILLKKKLNQAKTQIIHKLTRKAKSLTEKKAPDHLKEKLKRKAESAVREVLIIKKIKSKELGRFIVTHEGQLQQYLNRPQVDKDKACARLLLHKALQEKYKFIRSRFNDVPIKDLFMSREERLKLKKEAREEKKKKKDKKGGKVVNAQGDWDVEDVKIGNNKVEGKEISQNDDILMSSDESDGNASEGDVNSDDEESNVDESDEEPDLDKDQDIDFSLKKEEHNEEPDLDEVQNSGDCLKEEKRAESSEDHKEDRILPKVISVQVAKNKMKRSIHDEENTSKKDTLGKDIEKKFKVIEEEIKKKQNKKPKDANKNKNLNDKLISRKFKKDSEMITVNETKVVDPFFITSSGENYLSVAEPRQPDEVKEVHKQGNRQMRRAAMFGHVPKVKPKQNFYESNERYNRHNSYGNRPDNRYEKQNGFQKERFNDSKVNDFKNNRFNRQDIDSGQKRNFKDRNSQFKSEQEESKPEKLHPSWEAKKKQSGILPFQGKKTVFSED